MQTPPGRPPAPTCQHNELTSLTIEGGTAAPGHRIPAPAQPQKQPGRWVPPGEPVTIAGVTLPDGMVYVGTQLSSPACPVEPALLNPFMRVAQSEYDSAYFDAVGRPTYSILSPQNKKAYLRWLARGRKTPSTHVGYVFLFFYGLERRVLLDADAEVQVIHDEVLRLLSVYGGYRNFSQCATRFLGILKALLAPEKSYLDPHVGDNANVQNPFLFNYALGQLARDSYPLSAELALAWCHAHPYITLTRVAERFPAKFGELFKRRYRQTFGDGLILFPNQTRLTLQYSSATPGLTGEVPVPLPAVPDVRAAMNHAHKLQGLVNGCSVLLEPYTQLYSRTAGEITPFDELLHLPEELWSEGLLRGLEQLRGQLRPGEPHIVSVAALLDALGTAAQLARSAARKLGDGLAAAGISAYPDLRLAAKAPATDEQVALFPLLELDAADLMRFQAAEALVDALSLEDLLAGEPPEAALRRYLRNSTHRPGEQVRLFARALLRAGERATAAALKKAMTGVPPGTARTVGQGLAFLVTSHMAATPAQVKTLEKAYRAFDLDPQWVYSDLHGGVMPDLARPDAAERSSQPTLTLDVARIAQLQAETAEVSVMLADVFDEGVEPSAASSPTPTASAPTEREPSATAAAATAQVWSLDSAHAAFAQVIVTQAQWDRAALAAEARRYGLMLEGALETINEAAFDALDEALTEGDDPVGVNAEVGAAVPTPLTSS